MTIRPEKRIVKRFATVLLTAGFIFVSIKSVAALESGKVPLGWQPLVHLIGNGNADQMISRLDVLVETFESMFDRLDTDEYTDEFVDEAQSMLTSFEFEDFYEALPEGGPEGDKQWRWLALDGSRKGDRYSIGKSRGTTRFGRSVTEGTYKIGDMSGVFRAKPTTSAVSDDNYLVQTYFGIVFGDMNYRGAISAITTVLKFAESVSPTAEAIAAAEIAKKENKLKVDPRLQAILDELKLSFPNIYTRFEQIGAFETLRLTEDKGNGYLRVNGLGKLKPKLVNENYGKLANYLEGLDKLVYADIKWLDAKGRQLFNYEIDSDTLEVKFEFVIKEGLLVPFNGSDVYVKDVVDPWGDDLNNTYYKINSKSKVLGLIITASDFRVKFGYQPSADKLEVDLSITDMPKVKFSGAALGFIPPAFINLFIPGNMDQLTHDFLKVALEGNEGRGILIDFDFGKNSPDDMASMETGVGIEALNNFMIKFGVKIAMKHILPSDKEMNDLGRFVIDFRDAFKQDYAAFKTQMSGNHSSSSTPATQQTK